MFWCPEFIEDIKDSNLLDDHRDVEFSLRLVCYRDYCYVSLYRIVIFGSSLFSTYVFFPNRIEIV